MSKTKGFLVQKSKIYLVLEGSFQNGHPVWEKIAKGSKIDTPVWEKNSKKYILVRGTSLCPLCMEVLPTPPPPRRQDIFEGGL